MGNTFNNVRSNNLYDIPDGAVIVHSTKELWTKANDIMYTPGQHVIIAKGTGILASMATLFTHEKWKDNGISFKACGVDDTRIDITCNQ